MSKGAIALARRTVCFVGRGASGAPDKIHVKIK